MDMLLHYYVLFPTEYFDNNYRPIVPPGSYDTSGTTYIWDSELTGVLPAILYLLHLPRIGYDVISCDIDLLLHTTDEAHDILPIPFPLHDISQRKQLYNFLFDPTLIICPDEIYEEVVQDPDIPCPLLGICRMSSLNVELLHKHWKRISEFVLSHEKEESVCVPEADFPLVGKDEWQLLPLLPLANQFGYTKQLIDDRNSLLEDDNANKFNVAMHKRFLHICRLYFEKEPELRKKCESELIENRNFNGVPLVLTIPGGPNAQRKLMKTSKETPTVEHEVIDLLGVHRAAAKCALYLPLDDLPSKIFSSLSQLERHCRGKIDNRYVWNTLKSFGETLAQQLTPYQLELLRNASQLTVFSNFPVGLAILPEASAPLCCMKPISYQPLTPLTRAFQNELPKHPSIYLGGPFKIAVAECVEKDDPVRKYCDRFTCQLRNMVQSETDVFFASEEICSLEQFKTFLSRHRDAQILLISAHGVYNERNNMAGISIGNEIWMADDNDIHVPPVVLLSTCHNMPRGYGAVSVGDLFLRAGALAVLGTFIPVGVYRNAILFTRLFANMFEVRHGWSHMRTLDEIWQHTVASNAVHEIINSSPLLDRWFNTPRNGVTPNEEFKMHRSIGRLRITCVYKDTEQLLREMAYKDHIGHQFDAVINSSSYFPESVFYQLIGTPENVFLRNATVEKVFQQHGR